MSKADNEKAAAIAAFQKNLVTAKTAEDKLKACVAAGEIGEALIALSRAEMHTILEGYPEGATFELDGLPYTRVSRRGKGDPDGAPKLSLRCAISKRMLEKYELQKKS